MNYSANIKLSILESCHPDYSRNLPALQEIDVLTSGGYKLKKVIREFLPQRPGEDATTYEHRIKKFTYLNILGAAINDQINRLANGSLVISGLKDDKVWNSFRENTDLRGRNEKALISYILREILKFKKIYLHIDKPKVAVNPLNKAQEELLGIRPYVVTYTPFQVINWSEEEGYLKWIKVRQVIEDTSDPLQAATTKVIWTFIDGTHITKYGASVELDSYGNITKLDGEPVNEDTTASLIGESVPHGLGSIPVIKVELPDEVWVADQAASKALEHLRTDCSKYDLLTFAYFQRTYKKIQTPDSDFDVSHTDIDSEPLPSGLQHILELDEFKWNEPQGHILPHLMDSLRQIESQVKDLVSSGGFSASKGAVTQSGESKRMDFYKQETLLKSYGELLIDAYQKVLHLVAKSLGLSYEGISVTGLNSFDNDSLEHQIDKLVNLSKVDFTKLKEELPTEAYKLIYSDLISKAVGNVSAEQQELIKIDLESKLGS
jgi:hypothetical protein